MIVIICPKCKSKNIQYEDMDYYKCMDCDNVFTHGQANTGRYLDE